MPYHGLLASQASRLEALKSRHTALSHHIEKEQQHASSEDHQIKELKLARLHIKEEIEVLEEVGRA